MEEESQEVPDELSRKKANWHSYPHLDRIWHFSCLVQEAQPQFSRWRGGRDDQTPRFICYLHYSQASPVYFPRCSMLESGKSSVCLSHCLMLICSWANFRKVCKLPDLIRATLRGVHSTWMTLLALFIPPHRPDDPRETRQEGCISAGGIVSTAPLHCELSRWPYWCM